jgi:hypothetical protein
MRMEDIGPTVSSTKSSIALVVGVALAIGGGAMMLPDGPTYENEVEPTDSLEMGVGLYNYSELSEQGKETFEKAYRASQSDESGTYTITDEDDKPEDFAYTGGSGTTYQIYYQEEYYRLYTSKGGGLMSNLDTLVMGGVALVVGLFTIGLGMQSGEDDD